MYAFPKMLDMTNQKWPSEVHKVVAEKALMCNSRYRTMTDLMEGAKIIAEIPDDKIRLVTAADLQTLGIMFP